MNYACTSADIACFFAGYSVRFSFGMVFTWNLADMSLFEYTRSDSVLFNVI